MKKKLKIVFIGLAIILLIFVIADSHFSQQSRSARIDLVHATNDAQKSYSIYLKNPTESNKNDAYTKVNKARDIIKNNNFALEHFGSNSWKSSEIKLDQIYALLTYTDGIIWELWKSGVKVNKNKEIEIQAFDDAKSLEIVQHRLDDDTLICEVVAKKNIFYADADVVFYGDEPSVNPVGLVSNINNLKKGDVWKFEVDCPENVVCDGYFILFSHIGYAS